jgi:hypothetical protein
MPLEKLDMQSPSTAPRQLPGEKILDEDGGDQRPLAVAGSTSRHIDVTPSGFEFGMRLP